MATCKIEGCGKTAFCRGWCSQHYNRWQRHGDPLALTRNPPMQPGATSRTCPRCGQVKALDQYGVRPSGAAKGYCKPCMAEYDAEYAKTAEGAPKRKRAALKYSGSEKRLDLELRKRYGISAAEYHAMVKRQGGRCAICRSESVMVEQVDRRWHVDHCHKTGKVRGLLCNRCNMAIGLLGDDPDRAVRAAKYLRRHANA